MRNREGARRDDERMRGQREEDDEKKKGGTSRGVTTTSWLDERMRGRRNKRTWRVDAAASWHYKRYKRTLNDVYKWCPSRNIFPLSTNLVKPHFG